MSDFTIDELAIPQRVAPDDPAAADFIAATAVLADVEAAVIGTREHAYTAEEMLPTFGDPFNPRRIFVARSADRIVAVAEWERVVGESESATWISVQVLPGFRRRGIGTALYDVLLGLGTDSSGPVQSYGLFTPEAAANGAKTIPAPTGFGAAPVDDETSRFLLARGFELTQVTRMSRLTLPAQPIELADAPDYDTESWLGPTPQHRRADLAELNMRMSTDTPAGEADHPVEHWDEERVADADARRAQDGRLWLTTAVRHRATDRLVGYTEIVAPVDATRPAHQLNTLVLSEHRGHRLGTLLKFENLRHLERSSPGHPVVYTWNAEENRPMLDVNESMGFVAVAYEASWKLPLA